jgi:hypothetical protein
MLVRTCVIAGAVAAMGLGIVGRSAAGSLPANIRVVDGRLKPLVLGLLAISPRFAAQCAVIGRTGSLTVLLVRPADATVRQVHTRFRAVADDTGATVATIEFPVGTAPEMLAHAFEHVIESAEGRYPPGGSDPPSGAFRKADGSFETARAMEVERLVAQEVARAAPVRRDLLRFATGAGVAPPRLRVNGGVRRRD